MVQPPGDGLSMTLFPFLLFIRWYRKPRMNFLANPILSRTDPFLIFALPLEYVRAIRADIILVCLLP